MINLKKDLTGYKCNFAFMLILLLALNKDLWDKVKE